MNQFLLFFINHKVKPCQILFPLLTSIVNLIEQNIIFRRILKLSFNYFYQKLNLNIFVKSFIQLIILIM